MENKKKFEPTKSDLLTYLDIATKFRNHEFNIQMLRNMIFTGFQAVMIVCYTATVDTYPLASLAIALFGITLSALWFLYYGASIYWVRFWEHRCRCVNDNIVEKLGLDVNIFAGHPIGEEDNKPPPPIKYAGKTITWISIHKVIRWTQLVLCLLWMFLIVAAYVATKID
jgi:hypothetical protein